MVEERPATSSEEPGGHGALGAEVSRRLVGLLRDYTGRGPTKARSYVHDNLIVCVLEDTLTKGERAMADHGEEGSVVESRRAYQRLMRQEAAQVVEELTGRRVVAFLSDSNVDPDIAIEAFVLGERLTAGEAGGGR